MFFPARREKPFFGVGIDESTLEWAKAKVVIVDWVGYWGRRDKTFINRPGINARSARETQGSFTITYGTGTNVVSGRWWCWDITVVVVDLNRIWSGRRCRNVTGA